MSAHFDMLIVGAQIATMSVADDYGMLRDSVLGVDGGVIEYVGSESGELTGTVTVEAEGRVITPALVDCHTHLVFAGDRLDEYEQRLHGATYQEIAAAGGGIVSTVAATRRATEDELVALALPRLKWLLASGVGTVEIKSGYGLDLKTELRMLRAARRLGELTPATVTTSLLAAHCIPPEYRSDPESYVDFVCDVVIPGAAAEGLADAVDAFCEEIAFTPDQVRRVFDSGVANHLPVRLHADQLSDLGGAGLAAEYGALSADHLEHASRQGLEAMAAAGTVAVVIPGAGTFLNEPHAPPMTAMRAAGVRVAVASDLNPGTSPLGSMQLAMSLAASRYGLTPAEALQGATRIGAAALGLADRGQIAVGMRADLALWDVVSPAALSYWFGAPLLRTVWISGKEVA